MAYRGSALFTTNRKGEGCIFGLKQRPKCAAAKMKRFLAITMYLAMLLALATCASASQEGKLVIWADGTRAPVLEELGKEFTAKYKVPVEVQELGFGDIRDQLGVAGPAGKGPDIIVGAHDWLGELVTNGLIEPIDLQAKQKDFIKVSIDAFTWGNTLYGVPYAVEAVGLFYHKKLVPTPPKTWDDLVAICKRLTDKDRKQYGFLLPIPDPYHTFPIMSAAGGYVFGDNKDGTLNPLDVGLNNAGAVRGLSLLDKLVEDGLMPGSMDYNTMMGLFKDGKAGMMITGPWALGDLRDAKVPYGFATIPKIDGKDPRPFVGVQGFMISSFSKNKMLSKAFLNEYVATTDTMLALFNKDPRPPAYGPAAKAVSSDPDVAATGASAAAGVPMPAIPEMSAVWTAWSDAIDLTLTQKLDPKTALDDATAQIIATIKASKK
jgi:maltose/maltodextrin transport system substrate-binding protein